MSRLRPALLSAALAATASACPCGGPSAPTAHNGSATAPDSPEGTAAKGTAAEGTAAERASDAALRALLAGLPEAKVDHPIDALPGGLAVGAYSDDASRWLAFAEQRELYRALEATPLAEDLKTSGPWLALESLRFQVARVTSFAGGTNDGDALFKGPVAVAAEALQGDRPPFVLVKRVDPEVQVLARFAGAFASLAGRGERGPTGPRDESAEAVRPTVTAREVAGVEVRTVERRGERVSFALFRDLLIVGSSPKLVDRATALAAGAPLELPRSDERGRTERVRDRPAREAAAGLLPAPGTPGLHLSFTVPTGSVVHLAGLDGLGVSLAIDEKAPVVLRSRGGASPGPGAAELLRYAPGTAFFVFVDGRKPSETLLTRVQERLFGSGAGGSGAGGSGAGGSARVRSGRGSSGRDGADGGRAVKVGDVDVGARLFAHLSPGTALLFGARDPAKEPGAPAAVLAFRHADKPRVEPAARELLAALSGRDVERTVLEASGGALLLTTGEGGPAAAVTDDALLFALSPDRLRAALAAGTGQARSVKDRAGVALDGTATQALYIDLEAGAAFLRGFYAEAYAPGGAPEGALAAWNEAEAVLGPTFDALAKGGAVYGRLEPAPRGWSEGALRVLP